MMNLLGINLFPQANSDYANQVDALYFYLNAVTIFFTVLIAVLVVAFAVIYRRRGESDRPPDIHGSNVLEITWSVIPFGFMLVMFVWGTVLHFNQSKVPDDAIEILVTGKQWMWKVQHPNGKREINDLHVPAGRAVKLTITSEDVIHSYFIPSQRLKRDAVPGRYTSYNFTARETGKFHIFCAEYCGTEHSEMKGTLHVLTEADYQEWLNTGWLVPGQQQDPAGELIPTTNSTAAVKDPAPAPATGDTPPGDTPPGDATAIALGLKTFNEIGCMACHLPGEAAKFNPMPCPDLRGLIGKEVEFTDGSKMIRDENYIRESIANSMAKIVKGYIPGQMPQYEALLSEDQINGLVAWIKSLEEEN